jgi:hypothetical protein
MLLVIAALLAAGAARGEEPTPKQAQAQSAATRSINAVRVVPSDAEAADLASPAVPGQAPVVAPESRPHSSWYSLYDGKHIGLVLDGGVPAGAGLSAMFRPWSFIRLEGGVNYNYLSFGLRGGVTLIPFEFVVTPTLHAEGGHFFDGDASRFASDAAVKIVLKNVPADYLAASVGLEFGSQQGSVFFLRAGFSWTFTEARNVAAAINSTSTGSTTVKSAAPISILARTPTVSFGWMFFIY